MQHLIKWNVLIQPLVGRIFFFIYAFQTESDKMVLTFSLKCGMLIVRSWTVCLFPPTPHPECAIHRNVPDEGLGKQKFSV